MFRVVVGGVDFGIWILCKVVGDKGKDKCDRIRIIGRIMMDVK